MPLPSLTTRLESGLTNAALPLIYTFLFAVLVTTWKALDWPSPEECYAHIMQLYTTHGHLAVALAALVEGIVLANLYLPGSAVIILGVAAARGNPSEAFVVVAITTSMFILAAVLNYLIGYIGLHRCIRHLGGGRLLDDAQERYSRQGTKALLIASFHPNFAAFVAVACGIAKFPVKRFLSVAALGTVLWNILWGIVAYNLADVVENVATQPGLMFGLLATWSLVAFVAGLFKDRRDTVQNA